MVIYFPPSLLHQLYCRYTRHTVCLPNERLQCDPNSCRHVQTMSEVNKMKAMREEFTSFDTDAGPAATGYAVHPRGYGAFPRVLSHYVKGLGVLSLEGAIQRMSAVAANEIMAYDRGMLAPGLAADIVLFDFNTIEDRATFASPATLSEGVKWVIVNGKVVIENNMYTGAKPGKVIRGPGYKP